MKRMMIALVVALLPLAAQAQSAYTQGPPKTDKRDDPEKKKHAAEVDKAYRTTIKAIPDKNDKKEDPWANAR
jgi:hypothetical protein